MRALEARRVPHVYWKHAAGLQDALTQPRKDLDLLVAPETRAAAHEVLRDLGYRRMEGPFGAPRLPGVEHWLGLDPNILELDHVHLHEALYSGHPAWMEWRLPWVDHLLASSRPHPELGLRVLDPALDWVLLAVRAVLEPKHREGAVLQRATRTALDALAGESLASERARHAEGLLGSEAARIASAGRLEGEPWAAWDDTVRRGLAPSRRLSDAGVAVEWARGKGAGLRHALVRRVAPQRARHPAGLRRSGRGLVVAVIGADGAGKSTQVERLAVWLSSAVAVERAYLGRGDWVSSVQQGVAEAKWWLLERLTERRRPAPETDHHVPSPTQSDAESTASPTRFWVRTARQVSLLALADRKRRDLRHLRRLRDEGAVLVTDRFPHPTDRLLDGPALVARGSALGHGLARLERVVLARRAVEPDVVARLLVDPSVAHARKPDHRFGEIQAKAAAVRAAHYGGACMHDVDANAPPDDVQRALRRIVWEALA